MRLRQSIVKEKNLALSSIKKGGPRVVPKIEPGRVNGDISSSNGITSSSSSHGSSSSLIGVDSNSSTMNGNGSSSIDAMQIETNENNATIPDRILPLQPSSLNSSSTTVGAVKESHREAAMQSALEVGLVGSGLNDEINR
jgi:hypothetical protein